MSRSELRFPIAVVLTAVALVVGLFALGGVLANTALAGGPSNGGPPWAWGGRHRAGGGDCFGFATV